MLKDEGMSSGLEEFTATSSNNSYEEKELTPLNNLQKNSLDGSTILKI